MPSSEVGVMPARCLRKRSWPSQLHWSIWLVCSVTSLVEHACGKILFSRDAQSTSTKTLNVESPTLLRGSALHVEDRSLQSTCDTLSTALVDSPIGSYGNMFNVRTKDGAVTVTGLEFYTDLNAANGEVSYILYSKSGTFQGAEGDLSRWTREASGTVTGRGANEPTPIPNKLALGLGERSSRSFYITLTSQDLRYGYGSGERADQVVYAQNSDIQSKSLLSIICHACLL